MRALSPSEFSRLERIAEPCVYCVPDDDAIGTRASLAADGLVQFLTRESGHWRCIATDRGLRALRIHRAAIAAGVVS